MTAIVFAYERLLSCVSEIVLNKVLLERELLGTLGALPILFDFVHLGVTFQTVLGFETLTALQDVALVHLHL